MINNCLRLTNISVKVSEKHSGFMDVVLNGTDDRGILTQYSFTVEKIYQLSGFMSYLGFNSTEEMNMLSEIITIAMTDESELIAISKNATDEQDWLVLSTGRVTTLSVVNSIIQNKKRKSA